MYTYKLLAYGVLRSDGASIPLDLANSDYAQYQEWVKDGGVPTPMDAPTSAQNNAPVLQEIAALEASQGRAIREATLAIPGAVDKLTALNSKIVDLRKQIVS